MERRCPQCGTVFEAKFKTQRFCNPICRMKYHNAKLLRVYALVKDLDEGQMDRVVQFIQDMREGA